MHRRMDLRDAQSAPSRRWSHIKRRWPMYRMVDKSKSHSFVRERCRRRTKRLRVAVANNLVASPSSCGGRPR
jgi:hypothetical protein